MSDEDLFNTIANAKPVGKFANRLPIGNHEVVLKRFGIKKSDSGYGRIVEADFLVAASNTAEALSTLGWAWFPESKGFAGEYEQDRVKDFMQACADCIGDDRGIAEIGASLRGERQTGRGLTLNVEVVGQTDKHGKPKCGDDGNRYVNVTWKPIPQTLEQVTTRRGELDVLDGKVAAPADPAPAAEAAPAKPLTAGTSLLGRR